MDPNNPYAAPQVALIDEQAPRSLAGWSVGQLQLLAWLSLASIAMILVSLLAVMFAAEQPGSLSERVGDWLGLLSTVLGCYLLLRLRTFLEQRFAAKGLLIPIALIIVFSLLAEGLDWLWGDAIFTELGWKTLGFFATIMLMGVMTLWLGIVLLRIANPYPALRVMAWMEIVGGGMFASVVLVVVAIIPLLGGTLAMALVFFRGARELKGNQAA
ncbi:hypothetical protein [Pseudomonas sp. GOM6]|uniref:hypothetical protein n=1 Tax=Pseudomonas sp. GOM6 TaxID=3036944 RepID=UPI00240A4DB0|nr:hypothetical protein [Pseudomonas sp. GOM6]MDG1582492.1 hypothetical protein [Pseudomonas sp. GOM6]